LRPENIPPPLDVAAGFEKRELVVAGVEDDSVGFDVPKAG
jgi:hypothetical protein